MWGVVFPFIENEADFSTYDVRLSILTENGYTVYDPAQTFAFVQIGRGADEATLSGLELFMDFEGDSYKTTLRAPDASATRRYVFNLSAMGGKEPGYVSVAPIFLERGRSFVGSITSNLIIPFATIVLDIAQLVIDIDQEYDAGNEDSFVIVLNESILELDYSVCAPGEVEDPWGGCAIANGDLTNVTTSGFSSKLAWASGELDADWGGSKHVLFSYDGSESNNCLNGILKTVCFTLGGGAVNGGDDYFNVGVTENLTVASPCNSGSAYYVYDNSNCE